MTKLNLTHYNDRLHRVLIRRITTAKNEAALKKRTQRLKEYHVKSPPTRKD